MNPHLRHDLLAEKIEQARWPHVSIPTWHPRNEVATPPVAAVPLDPVVTEIPPPPVNAAPWTADLAAAFPDEAVRNQVDTYLRTTQQPRMTQLEQQLADLAPAKAVYDDLLADPQGTMTALVTELFDEAKATDFELLFAIPDPAAAPPAAPDEISLDKLPPAVRAVVERDAARQQAEEAADEAALYNSTVDQLIEGHAELTPEDKDHIHPFIANAKGDLAAATVNYIARRAALAAHAAPVVPLTPEQQAAADAAVLAALPPVTLGTAPAVVTGAPAAPRKKENIDEALSGWFAENRAAKAAPLTV